MPKNLLIVESPAKAKTIANRTKWAVDELWLDADTYKLTSVADEQTLFPDNEEALPVAG